jgi:hypothetical protein
MALCPTSPGLTGRDVRRSKKIDSYPGPLSACRSHFEKLKRLVKKMTSEAASPKHKKNGERTLRMQGTEIPRSETYFVAYVAATRNEGKTQMGVFHKSVS